MKREHAPKRLLSALAGLAVGFVTSARAEGAVRYRLKTVGHVAGFEASHLVNLLTSRLTTSDALREDGGPFDVELTITLSNGPQGGCTPDVCAIASLKWWDGQTSQREGLCATRPSSMTCTTLEPPNERALNARIVTPLAEQFEADKGNRWIATLMNGEPPRPTELSVEVANVDAGAHVAWGGSVGTLSVREGGEVPVQRGACEATLTRERPKLDVSDLWQSTRMKFQWEVDHSPMEQIRTTKGSTVELALLSSPGDASGTEVPCTGKLIAELDVSPKQYEFQPLDSGSTPRSAWTLTTKAQQGVVTARLHAANAVKGAGLVSIGIRFDEPWWMRAGRITLAIAGGIAAVAGAIKGVVALLKPKSDKKGKDDDDDDDDNKEEQGDKSEKKKEVPSEDSGA